MKFRLPGASASLCAAFMAIAAAMTGTAGAHADTPLAATDPAASGKPLVILGDSYTANGWAPFSNEKKCDHGDTAWPVQLSALMGVSGDQVWNQSCPGATIEGGDGYTLTVQAANAAKAGAFGPGTKLVTIQLGFNDHWGGADKSPWSSTEACFYDLAGGCGPEAVADGRMVDPRNITGTEYAARISKVVTYIRYYAPNARIVIVGYPELFRPDQQSICFDIVGVPVTQPDGRTVVEYFNRMDQAEREAAATMNLDYLDARALTAGHGLCTPQQWINGVFDPLVKVDGLPFHPAPQGDAVIANALYERYAR
ncbi:SGNH/GDSL hydrolase family protein [Nocardia sp. CDC153]|uniref:SGNH/GDSL hydrolase family protein n=1 Tax=Nocardia sp. CDC153 TaxID=3112167 RepID=UPI002DB883C1|nr:SGNH/GDSL hydrolase family protein [Nocardia sp. CDC153]MEC3952355.1 SGNH/GDSL hydrolase family protein [Nocardia sp. CDC153]